MYNMVIKAFSGGSHIFLFNLYLSTPVRISIHVFCSPGELSFHGQMYQESNPVTENEIKNCQSKISPG